MRFAEKVDALPPKRKHKISPRAGLWPGKNGPRPERGPAGLSGSEIEVLNHLAKGETYGQIAYATGRSVSTVRTHLHNTYGKLGAVDRAQAVLRAAELGVIEGEVGLASILAEPDPDTEEHRREVEQASFPTKPRPWTPDPDKRAQTADSPNDISDADPYLADVELGDRDGRVHEGVLADTLIVTHLKGIEGTAGQWTEVCEAVDSASTDKERRDMLVKAAAIAMDWAARLDQRRFPKPLRRPRD